jgi:6-phosphogluconolactonase
LDGTGRYIFSANYNDATVACFRLKADGSVGEQTALRRLTGSGPDQSRQEAAHAHSVYADPANKFVYSCDLGSDHVWSFKFDAAQGSLTPTDPPFATVPPGSGPRHLAFHPNGRFVYVSNEMGHSVTAFTRNAATGALTPFQTLSTLAPGASYPGITITTAEIACDATGKWLYVSNRGCETLSLFSIAADGKLALAQTTPCVAKFPRFFTLDPTGRWLLSAGQKDGHIAVLKLDPATGQMTATDQVVTTIDPTCILFVPQAK